MITFMKRAKLVLHPVRLRILQTLAGGQETTQGLSERLPDIPRSSIYRHLRLLVDANLAEIAETRKVRGVDERVYRLGDSAHLSAEDVAGLSADEHLAMFSTYVLTLIQDFSAYLERAERRGQSPDFASDRVGYTEVVVHVTDDEFDAIAHKLQAAIHPYISTKPGPQTTARKLSTITFPVAQKGDNQHETTTAHPARNGAGDQTDDDNP